MKVHVFKDKQEVCAGEVVSILPTGRGDKVYVMRDDNDTLQGFSLVDHVITRKKAGRNG